ncbi:hypothetical protein ACH4SP_07685 [Streptomyces sp. NPDC021093]
MTVEQVAADFGVHPVALWKWMRRARALMRRPRLGPPARNCGSRS